MAQRVKRDPKTKEQLLDRMLSFDFDGDIRNLGEEAATVQRTGPNTLLLKFPATGIVFELEVHRPREFAQTKAASEPRSFKRTAGETRIEPVEDGGAEKAPRTKRRYTRRQERRAQA